MRLNINQPIKKAAVWSSAYLRQERAISARFLVLVFFEQALLVKLPPEPHLFQPQRFAAANRVVAQSLQPQYPAIDNLLLGLAHVHFDFGQLELALGCLFGFVLGTVTRHQGPGNGQALFLATIDRLGFASVHSAHDNYIMAPEF